MNDEIYNIIVFSIFKLGKDPWKIIATKEQFTFLKFSQQWLAIIMIFPYFGLIMMRKLDFLIKFTALGIITVFLYFFFIIYAFMDNIKMI